MDQIWRARTPWGPYWGVRARRGAGGGAPRRARGGRGRGYVENRSAAPDKFTTQPNVVPLIGDAPHVKW
jgi:hypothetical protein